MTEQLDFGKGLVICLVKFAEHLLSYNRWVETNKAIGADDAAEMYFNGASDHLYEIEVPKAWKGTEIAKKVKELQDLGLEVGHGFTDKKYSSVEVKRAQKLTHEIALLIDASIGLMPQEGQW
jgi:hypothetical protein